MKNNYFCINQANQFLCDKLIEEYDELDKKIRKLKDFMSTPEYRSLEYGRRDLISRQFYSMLQYQCILDCRINDFIMNP